MTTSEQLTLDISSERTLTLFRRTGRELGALVGLFWVSLPAFIVCVTLFSVGLGTVVIVVGLLHVPISFALATASFSITVGWVAEDSAG